MRRKLHRPFCYGLPSRQTRSLALPFSCMHPPRSVLPALLILVCLVPGSSSPGRAAAQSPSPQPDAQRVVELSRIGGLVSAAVALPDGSVLAAEGSMLVHLSPTYPPTILSRVDLAHGSIIDLARPANHTLVLTEGGLISLTTANDARFTIISFVPGGGQALAIHDDLAVIAAHDAGLRILRLSSDGLLAPLSELSLADAALDVAFSPDVKRVYVAAAGSGIHSVDLSDPAAPRDLGPLPGTAPANAVAMLGALLAVASEGRVLSVDPAAGQVVGTYTPLHEGRRILVQEDYAYIADSTDGVKILYLAAPDRPIQIYGEADRPAYDLWLDGNLLYVAGADGLRILDVGSRYRPLALGHIKLPGLAQGLAVDSGSSRAFVALGENGIAVLDVQNLASPRLTRLIRLAGPAYAVHFDNNLIYTALGQAGLAMIEAPVGAERLLATFTLPGAAYDLARRGRTLYVAAGDAGLLAVDISRPAEPVLTAVLSLEPLSSRAASPKREALSVAISGKRAYVSYGDGFLVADVSRADRLGRLTQVATPATHIAVGDTYLYALHGGRLTTFDARATAEPVKLRAYIAPSTFSDLSVRGDYIFAAHTAPGPDLIVLSFASPDYPTETDNEGELGHTVRAMPVGGEVWLAAGFAGLHRYDVTEGGALIPRGGYAPVLEAGSLGLQGALLAAAGRSGWMLLARDPDGTLSAITRSPDSLAAVDVAFDGNQAAVAAGEQGVALYDLSNSSEPQLIAQQETQGPARAVALDQTFIYVADAGGLSLFDRRYALPVARIATPLPAVDLALYEDRAYLALSDGSLAVVTLSDPTQALTVRRAIPTRRPFDLVDFGESNRLYGIADNSIYRLRTESLERLGILEDSTLPVIPIASFVAGDLLATISPDGVLRYYDVTDLSIGVSWRGAAELTNIDTPVHDVVLDRGSAYVALGDAGLTVIDLTSPGNRTALYTEPIYAVYRHPDQATLLFAAGRDVTVWDISSPGAAVQLGRISLTGSARHIDPAFSASELTLLISLENGVSVVNWDAGSTKLTESGRWYGPSVDRAVVIGSRAYLALHRGGLLALDLRDVAHPTPLFAMASSYGQFVHDLLVADDSLLLVSWDGGIEVLSASEAVPVPHLVAVTPGADASARSITLSADGALAAIALAEEGVQLFDLTDPSAPSRQGLIDTPGTALAAAFSKNEIFVADGECGLRVFELASLKETGYWRGSYASALALSDTSDLESVTLYLGEGSQLVALRYDPLLPGAPPPAPQAPRPADGEGGLALATELAWNPPADPCEPLTYDVYFGLSENPPLAGQTIGETALDVGPLNPGKAYWWRVEATDRQGDRITGPTWHFFTATGTFPDVVPPAPPVFIDQLRQSPIVPFSLVGVFLVIAIMTTLYWRTRQSHEPQELPLDRADWFTDDDEQILESRDEDLR